MVSLITEELVRLGHEVTLFASGDSVTSARLHPTWETAVRLRPAPCNPQAIIALHLERAFAAARDCDLIHSHMDFYALPVARRSPVPVLTTIHGRLDLPELAALYGEFREHALVSISRAQRAYLPEANWMGTVHHGLPRDLYRYQAEPGKYLAFLGRLAPEKCPDQAIRLAREVGVPLRIAAKIDPADRVYFHEVIEPLLAHPLIEFVGEIDDAQKNDFLGNALALVAPFDWPEPFGLVFIEAFACGTPVVAYRRGSVPEIVEHGRTGFVCDSFAEMVERVEQVPALSRAACRRAFEDRFTVDRMVRDYVAIYHRMLHEGRPRRPSVRVRHGGDSADRLRDRRAGRRTGAGQTR